MGDALADEGLDAAAFGGVGLLGAGFMGVAFASVGLLGAAFAAIVFTGADFLTAGLGFCVEGLALATVAGLAALVGFPFAAVFLTAGFATAFDRDADAPTDLEGFFGLTEEVVADFVRVLDLALGLAGEFRKLNLSSQFNLVQYLGQLRIVGHLTSAANGLRQLHQPILRHVANQQSMPKLV